MSVTTTAPPPLGDSIRAARDAAGLTQQEVVAELQRRGAAVSQQTYSHYERNRVTVSAPMLGILAELFEVDAITALEWLRSAARSGKAR